jgi:zinc transporter ZupT
MGTENTVLFQFFFSALLKILSEFGYHYLSTYFEDEEISVRLVKYSVVIIRSWVVFAYIYICDSKNVLCPYIYH